MKGAPRIHTTHDIRRFSFRTQHGPTCAVHRQYRTGTGAGTGTVILVYYIYLYRMCRELSRPKVL